MSTNLFREEKKTCQCCKEVCIPVQFFFLSFFNPSVPDGLAWLTRHRRPIGMWISEFDWGRSYSPTPRTPCRPRARAAALIPLAGKHLTQLSVMRLRVSSAWLEPRRIPAQHYHGDLYKALTKTSIHFVQGKFISFFLFTLLPIYRINLFIERFASSLQFKFIIWMIFGMIC